jgi:hypothetical protein
LGRVKRREARDSLQDGDERVLGVKQVVERGQHLGRVRGWVRARGRVRGWVRGSSFASGSGLGFGLGLGSGLGLGYHGVHQLTVTVAVTVTVTRTPN